MILPNIMLKNTTVKNIMLKNIKLCIFQKFNLFQATFQLFENSGLKSFFNHLDEYALDNIILKKNEILKDVLSTDVLTDVSNDVSNDMSIVDKYKKTVYKN